VACGEDPLRRSSSYCIVEAGFAVALEFPGINFPPSLPDLTGAHNQLHLVLEQRSDVVGSGATRMLRQVDG